MSRYTKKHYEFAATEIKNLCPDLSVRNLQALTGMLAQAADTEEALAKLCRDRPKWMAELINHGLWRDPVPQEVKHA